MLAVLVSGCAALTPDAVARTTGTTRTQAVLSSVSCSGPRWCEAVGYADAGVPGSGRLLIERWDGRDWRVQSPAVIPSPQLGVASLSSVSCTGRSECTAVGMELLSNGVIEPLVERWDGSSWTIQPAADPPGGGSFAAVSCTATNVCTAVGSWEGNPQDLSQLGSQVPLVERWDGANWTIQTTPPTPGPGSGLDAISCSSNSACTAVGGELEISGTAALAEAWDGNAWVDAPVPAPDTHKADPAPLVAVSCTSAPSCTAVGSGSLDALGHIAAFADRWNGSAWRSLRYRLAPATGIWCHSASWCIAVGSFSRGAAARWNGNHWKTQRTAKGRLLAISCTSTTECIAVGERSGTTPLAERWNGYGWVGQRTAG